MAYISIFCNFSRDPTVPLRTQRGMCRSKENPFKRVNTQAGESEAHLEAGVWLTLYAVTASWQHNSTRRGAQHRFRVLYSPRLASVREM
jgi:hypothetical protein